MCGLVAATTGHAQTTPPEGLYGSAYATTVVQLRWLDRSATETGYRVERRIGEGAWSTVSTTGADVTTLRVTGLVAGTDYRFRIRTVQGSTVGEPSAEVRVPTPPGPEVIVDDNGPGVVVASTVGSWNTIYLNPRDHWGTRGFEDRNTDKDKRTVRWPFTVPSDGRWVVYHFQPTQGDAPNVPFDIEHSGGTTTVFLDQGQADNAWLPLGAFDFRADTPGAVTIRTTGTTRTVIADAIRLVPAPTTAPAAPTGFVATAVGPGRVDLRWVDEATNEYGFIVERAPAGTETWTRVQLAPPNANRAEVTGFAAESSWRFRVRAVNVVGESAALVAEATTLTARTRRLWVNETELASIRAAVAVPGSFHQRVFAALRARVEQRDWRVYDENATDNNWNYARSWLAREAATLYLVGRDPEHARIAYQALRDIVFQPDPDRRLPSSGYSNGSNMDLSRAMVGWGFAIAYDFAADGWTAAERDWVRSEIVAAVEAWPSVGVPNAQHPQVSNHVGVARSGELVMILALDEEQSRLERVATLRSALNTHIANAYGPTGFTSEGSGYAAYAGSFLAPAVLALESVGDATLANAYRGRSPWLLPMYGFTPRAHPTTGNLYVLQNGVDGGAPGNQEGFASALLRLVPAASLPAFRGWYDLTLGLSSALPDSGKFDFKRSGSVWALLFHPRDGAPVNPSAALPRWLRDDAMGFVMTRNRWQDTDDVQVGIFADHKGATNAWDAPEAFQVTVSAFGHSWIGGPGKQTTAPFFSTLLVDGKSHVSTNDVGQLLEWTPDAVGGGRARIGGGNKYSKLGLSAAEREVLVDLSGRGAPAWVVLRDRVASTTARTLTVNLNLGDDSSNHGLVARLEPAGDRAAFTVRGTNGAWMRGWVPSHPDAVLRMPADGSNEPLQVEVAGVTAADLVVVLAFGRGDVPTGTVAGSGTAGAVTVGSAQVRVDPVSDRLELAAVAADPFVAWAQAGLPPGFSTEPTADDDGDGIPLLLEYALGGDPTGGGRPVDAAFVAGPGAGDDRPRVRLQRPVRAGVALRAETAATLAGPWTTATPESSSTADGVVTETWVLDGFLRWVAARE